MKKVKVKLYDYLYCMYSIRIISGSTVMIPSLMHRPHDPYSLYAISSPLENINSVFVRPPCFTKWYGSVVLNFKDGSSSAPLWFHDDESRSTVLQKNTQGGKFSDDQGTDCQVRWGGDEFMHRLCQLTQVTRYVFECVSIHAR